MNWWLVIELWIEGRSDETQRSALMQTGENLDFEIDFFRAGGSVVTV